MVVGVVSLVVVLVLATGVGTYFALRPFLLTRLDQQLTATASVPSINRLLSPSERGFGGLQVPQKIWVAILDKSGSPTTYQPTGPEFSQLTLTDAQARELASGTAGPVSRMTVDHTHVRLVAVNALLGQTNTVTGIATQQPVTVLVGLSQGEVDRTLARLVVLEWVIGGAAVALALLTTTYGVRLGLRPLRRVTSTAREVTAELSPEGAGLDRRVAVTESDTEVGQLADSMNTLLAAVETQFAARLAHEEQMRQFLADASHELRTPLTSIRGYAELARMKGESGVGSETADNLARIESEGTRMSRLVDDLLTLARSDRGNTPRNEWVDMNDLVGDAVTDARAAYPTRRIDESVVNGLAVIGDRDQLLRVVRNLVTNAAIHTRPDGPIAVSAVRESDLVVIRVSDSGPGLPAEEAAHVFERFWRADKARTRVRGGTGLGLAIVASTVQAHGGSVRFDSTVETGSTVTVSLPIATA
ncbi:MAG: HAMP domain-containing histidine kinase [Actinomycetota bacterium]|nr:HAMP domain-containing histidine kinase [Actinomycetota bacterium]